MSINQFLTKIGYGARANLFEVEILGLGDTVNFMCKGASIPSRTITSIPLKFRNVTLPIAGETNFVDWTITIINDVGFTIRKNLEDWMNSIRSANGYDVMTHKVGKNYYKYAVVKSVSNLDFSVYEYTLYNIFPTDLGQIDLSWDSPNTVQEYSVTFTYSHWVGEQSIAGMITTLSPVIFGGGS